jgi:hypothetical protein
VPGRSTEANALEQKPPDAHEDESVRDPRVVLYRNLFSKRRKLSRE